MAEHDRRSELEVGVVDPLGIDKHDPFVGIELADLLPGQPFRELLVKTDHVADPDDPSATVSGLQSDNWCGPGGRPRAPSANYRAGEGIRTLTSASRDSQPSRDPAVTTQACAGNRIPLHLSPACHIPRRVAATRQ